MDTELTTEAKQIIQKILYATVATSSKEGLPWNSPVFTGYDSDYNFYWRSALKSQHSRNISENPNVFIVIYDSTSPFGDGQGVYIKAKVYELSDEKEIEQALMCMDGRVGRDPEPVSDYVGDMPRRVYKAVPEIFWISDDGEEKRKFVDIRIEVALKDNQ